MLSLWLLSVVTLRLRPSRACYAYPLPVNKTKSVYKTDTHQGAGFNELVFEDQKVQQLIYMNGQKDQQIDILNDCKFVIKGPGGSGECRCQP